MKVTLFDTIDTPQTIKVTWAYYEPDYEDVVTGASWTKASAATISVKDSEGKWIDIAKGVAFCHSLDNFDKEKGRKISLARALTKAGYPKSSRIQVWDAYFSR